MVDANVAVLIDYENVGLDAIQHLLDQLSDVGRVIIRRAYGDWSVQRGKQDQLLELGIEPIHQYHSNKSGKNSSDIRLAIEAVDLLYNSPIDTFVIVSSDSDFVPLVGKLRSSGKSVIVAGRREATSPTLIKSCDRYIFLDAAKQAATQASQPRRRSGRRNGSQAQQSANLEVEARTLLLRALDASMDESGQVVGSKLYQTMRRIEPSFNFKDLKHRLFSQFLETHTDVIDITRPRDGGGDVVVQYGARDHITPPQVSANNENRAAKLVDPRQIDRESSTETGSDDQQPKRGRAQSGRAQAEGRSRSGRRLLGSTRPAGERQQTPASSEDAPEERDESAEPAKPASSASGADKQPKSKASKRAPKSEKQVASDASKADAEPASISWEMGVNAAWTKRDSDRITARAAATDAAKVLGAPKLGASQYPTLQKLLAASTLLQLNWRREGNYIFRK